MTPETDAKESPHIGFYSCATVPADFARKLERERDEAREELANLESLMFGGLVQPAPKNALAWRVFDAVMAMKKERDEAREDLEFRLGLYKVLYEANSRLMTVNEEAVKLARTLKQERDEAREQLSAAKREAENLATHIHRAEYFNDAPSWELCDSVAGVISQIDNMYAGVREQRDEAREDATNYYARIGELERERDEAIFVMRETRRRLDDAWLEIERLKLK